MKVQELKEMFEKGLLGCKLVPKWDEYGNGWWKGNELVMHSVPADWPFSSAGFPNDWQAYARHRCTNK